MPYEWTAPEYFMVLDDEDERVVYHAYKDGNANERLENWYQTDDQEDDNYEFDVRELPGYSEDKTHEEIIEAAAAAGAIKFP